MMNSSYFLSTLPTYFIIISMRTVKTWLAAIGVLLCSVSASAHDFEVDGIYYNITSDTDLTAAVTYRGTYYDSYSNEYGGAVIIPSTVTYNSKTYRVTSIRSYAFHNCSNLTSVTLPESVTSIWNDAFYGCSSLTSITLPESVAGIGSSAFGGCSSLTSITLPESVASIGSHAFYGCSSLTSITIPASVTSIGVPAFIGCTSLVSVVVAKGNAKYDSRDNCNGIIETSTNTLIVGCSHTTIPKTVTSIGQNAFSSYTNLTSLVIPNGVTSIGSSAFSDCTNLRSIEIPNTITTIKDCTFSNCYSLASIDIPNSVTSIGSCAFSECYSLGTITIPESVTSMGSEAFRNCMGELIVNCDIPNYYSSQSPFRGSLFSRITIGDKVTSIGDYSFYGNYNLTAVKIGKGVTAIGSGAFCSCSDLTTINIPYGVTSIGERAFEYCEKLTSIDLPESLINVAGNAFSRCKSLTSIDFPDGMTEISLYGCDGLTSIDIPQGVTSVYINGYAGTSIRIPEGVTSLNLSGSTNLVSINIPKSVTDLDLAYCSSLTSVDIPEGLTDLHLAGCSSLKSVTIPASLTSISGDNFGGCAKLTSLAVAEGNPKYDSRNNCNAIIETASDELIVGCAATVIPNTIYMIGRSAFSGSQTLTSINIPESVSYIDDYAFADCSNLASVTLPNSLSSIGYGAFRNSSALTSVHIPKNVYWIEGNPWYGCENIECISVDTENERFDSRNNCNAVIDNYNSRPLVVGCKNTTIPDDVSVIGEYAFYGSKGLTSIYIPNSVYAIETCAFANSGLTSVSLPGGLETLGSNVFEGCANLTSFIIPECKTKIYSGEFSGCTSLKTIKIPNTVTEIGANAFEECGIESIIIPNTVTEIGSSAFKNCTKLTSVKLPSSITVLPHEIFMGCTNLKTYDLEGIKEIGQYAFKNSGIESIHIPASVQSISNFAFGECKGLKSVSFAQGFTGNPSAGMFVECTSLEEIIVEDGNPKYDSRDNCNSLIFSDKQLVQGCNNSVIPQGVNVIVPLAFCRMTLSDIVIPSSVNLIMQQAFAGASINSITCQATIPPAVDYQAFIDVDTSIPVYVPMSAFSDYCTHPGWSQFTNILPLDNDIVINDNTEEFLNARNLYNVNITYTRTLSKTNTWNALYVPFEIPMTEEFLEDYDVAYFNDIHSSDSNHDGEIDAMEMEVLMVQEGEVLNANHPYLIRAKNADALNMNVRVEDATLYKTKETTLSCSSVYMKFDVTGIYTTQTAGELKGEFDVYAMSGGGWKQALNPAQQLKPFRLYLKLTSIDGSPVKVSQSALSRINIRLQGEDSETGIDELKGENGNVKSEIFDLSGRRVHKAQKGIFIQNGKKVIM